MPKISEHELDRLLQLSDNCLEILNGLSNELKITELGKDLITISQGITSVHCGVKMRKFKNLFMDLCNTEDKFEKHERMINSLMSQVKRDGKRADFDLSISEMIINAEMLAG